MAQADPAPTRSVPTSRLVTAMVLVAALVGGFYLLGVTHPAKRSAITSDRLGPDSGVAVSDYLDDAARGLARVGSGPRWALISLRAAVDDATAWSLMTDTLQSQVAFHVPITDVATATKFEAVTGDERSLITARTNAVADIAADDGLSSTGAAGSVDRGQRRSSVTIGRLRSGCACIVAMVVRADATRLRALAASAQVRSVEVLPADAAGGRFSVIPLLPEQTDRVVPITDTAAVPER